MPSASEILKQLKSHAAEKTRAIYINHGAPPERILGVSVADLKTIEKSIRQDLKKTLGKGREADRQSLALALYATGFQDAMYLAGMLADGSRMTPEELNHWAREAAGLNMIAEYTVAWVAIEYPTAPNLANQWIDTPSEYPAVSGWCTWSGLVTTRPDSVLDLKEIQSLLDRIQRQIHTAPNRVRSTMNSFLIAVGSYVSPLAASAKAAAKAIGPVTVDVGNTSCKVPSALEYIAKAESRNPTGTKRKTIRC